MRVGKGNNSSVEIISNGDINNKMKTLIFSFFFFENMNLNNMNNNKKNKKKQNNKKQQKKKTKTKHELKTLI